MELPGTKSIINDPRSLLRLHLATESKATPVADSVVTLTHTQPSSISTATENGQSRYSCVGCARRDYHINSLAGEQMRERNCGN